jgi:hypothetical protein
MLLGCSSFDSPKRPGEESAKPRARVELTPLVPEIEQTASYLIRRRICLNTFSPIPCRR